jgi:hypothetical protein
VTGEGDGAPGSEGPQPPPTLARAIRGAFSAYLDEIVLFLLVNAAWFAIVVVCTIAWTLIPLLLLILAPLLALPTAVLMRLAVAAAHERTPRWSIATSELGRLWGRKLLLAAVQLLVLALGLANVTLAPQIGGLLGVLSGLAAGYAVVASSVYAVAVWPIVCDPEREAPLADQLRLAFGVIALRPLQVGVLTVIVVLCVVVAIQLVVPAIFLPGLVLIVVAGYVVPVAERLRTVAS